MKKINIAVILILVLFSIKLGSSLCCINSSYPYHSPSSDTEVHIILAT